MMSEEVKDPAQDHTQQQQPQPTLQELPQPPPQPPPPILPQQHTTTTLVSMQAAATAQPIVPQGSPQVGQQQAVQQATMTQVMQQGPQPAHSPHGVATSMPPQSPQCFAFLSCYGSHKDDIINNKNSNNNIRHNRSNNDADADDNLSLYSNTFYVQASLASGMQPAPPAIAPAPGPQTSTTTVSALHQPLQHHLAPQTLTHPGVSPSPMPQFSPQVQVIQSGIPGAPYLPQLYQNAQGQIIMPSNLTLQTATGMNATPIQPNTLNGLNQPIQFPQVIAAATGKPFQGQIAPHMLTTATGKAGVIQTGGQAGYSPAAIPTTGSQTLVIGQLPVGVISSQQHNILPAHSVSHKSTDMQKQQSISWAPGALHSPALLAQNQIFIRGAQPGQDNVFISNPQPQPMHVPNSMMPPLQTMQQGAQTQKPRSGMDMQPNIQPKAPNMRPPILPSNPTQIRPGASVSTQTAGQQLAPGHISAPRAQNKMRGKSGANRTSPAMAGSAQIAAAQASQTAVAAAVTAVPTATAVAVNAGTQVVQQQAAVTPVTIPNPATPISAPNKVISQAAPMQAITSMAQAKPGVPMAPPTAPLPPAGQPPPSLPQLVRAPTPKSQQAAVSIPQSSVAPSPPALISSSSIQAPTHIQPLTTQAPISTPAPVLAPATMPPPQVTCAVTQVQTSLQPPSLAPAMGPVSTAPSTVQPKTEVKTEMSPPKKVTPVAPMTAPTPAPAVSGAVTPVTPAQPQQTPPPVATVNGTAPSSESGEVSDKTPQPTMNGTAHPVAPQPSATGPPKAMVKPQVLTHVIEGFVIHEASEPFPVSRSSLLTEISKPRPPNYSNTVAAVTSSSNQTPIGGQAEKENLPDDEAARKKACELTSTSPKGDTAKCEFCGKTDLRSKFKRSKRFCSTSCAKRYNVGCSKRIGLFKNPEEPPSKRMREDGSLEETDINSQLEAAELQENEGHMESEEMAEGEEDGSTVPESPTKSHRVDILKWTVKDVVDFIQNLPGCKEYAEDFALQEIDGQALMLLKADHLMSAMSMKLGPALKICAKIESMRGDRKET